MGIILAGEGIFQWSISQKRECKRVSERDQFDVVREGAGKNDAANEGIEVAINRVPSIKIPIASRSFSPPSQPS
jgi:hypothetical protein